MILKSLTSSISNGNPELPNLESNVYVDGLSALDFDIDILFDIEEIFPTSLSSQVVSLLVHVEDFGYIYPYEIVSFNFYRDIEEGARLSLSIRGDRPKILTELNWRTSPPGLKKIQVWAGYKTSNGLSWKKLMTDGLSDSSERTISSSGAVMAIEVIDMKHRYRCMKLNYHVKPNSDKLVTDIIKEIAEEIGINSVSVPSGKDFRTNKEITINCEAAWPKLEEYASYIGCRINFDEYGSLKLYDVGEYSESFYSHIIRDSNIVDGEQFTISFPGGEIATAITIKGEKSENKECGTVTLTTTKISKGPRTITGPAWSQDSVTGNLTLTGYIDQYLESDVLSEVITIMEIQCGTLIQETVITKGWKRRELWRYHLDNTGSIDDYSGGWIMEPGASKDDGSKCYIDFFEKFVILSKVTTRYYYSNSSYYIDDGNGDYYYSSPSKYHVPFLIENLKVRFLTNSNLERTKDVQGQAIQCDVWGQRPL